MGVPLWVWIVAGAGVLVVAILVLLVWRSPLRLRKTYFLRQWRDLQKLCKDQTTWPEAVHRADDLLLLALRKKRFRGKSMGERMVAAQRVFSNNDSLWFAHNMRKKLQENHDAKLKEAEVKSALVGFRQGLKDLGVLENGEPKNP